MSYKFSTGSVRQGDVYFEDDRDGQPTYIDFGQDTITLRPSGSQMLYVQSDAVGVNTTSPDYTLHVAGDMSVDENIYHNGDADTLIQFANDKIVLKAGSRAMITTEINPSQPHEVTINDGANNVDFVVKGNGSGAGNPGMKFDASTNRLGINGVGTPSHTLTVAGDISASLNVSASAFYGDGSNLTGIGGGGGGGSNTITNMTHHRYNDGSGTGLEYIPWAGTSEQPSPSWITQGVAAYAGKLLKVLVRSSKSNPTMGSTTVGIHINVDNNTVVNQTPEETQTVNMTAANTTYTFSFSNANHFGPGDIIGVSIDPTGPHGNVNVTCVWEYDIT